MINHSSLSHLHEKAAYIKLFDALAGHNLLLEANPPHFTILAATPQRLQDVGMTKEAVIGKALFEAHPGNTTDPTDNGVSNLRFSLDQVLQHKEIHHLPVQRYDLRDNEGGFLEKYWSASNRPVLDEEGEVAYIIHTAEDITHEVLSNAREDKMKGMEVVNHLFKQTPIPVCLLKGPELLVELANEPTLRLWGKTKQVIGLPLEQAVPEVKGQGYAELIHEVRETGIAKQVYESPVTLLRNGKEEVAYINYVYEPYYEEDSAKVTGVLAIGTDVTDKVLAKKKSEESEAKFRTLFENMDQGFSIIEMIFSEEGKPVNSLFLEMNAVFEKQSGFIGAVGKKIRDIVPGIEDKWFDLYGKVALTGKAIRFTDRSEALDKWFDIYAFPAGKVGSHRVAVLFTDITEQVQALKKIEESESRFRKLADESPIFVFMIEAGPLATVSYWNKTWLDYTGQSAEEAIGRAWNGIIHPDDVSLVMEHYTPALRAQAPYFIPAVRVKRRDGVFRWHSFKGNPRHNSSGDFSGYVGVGFDIHEQKLSEEGLEEIVSKRTAELHLANKELQRSNQNLEEFAHAASHDLKEPVRKIHTFTGRLKSQLADRLKEEEKFTFTRIEKATERMGNLIDDLLLFSHVSQRPHETETIDLNQKVHRVLEDLELDIAEKKAVINVEKLPIVNGYRRQLQQLFQNLLSNALKYSKKDVPPHIDIWASQVTENNQTYYMISVKDNGIGFEQEYADKIFQMFTRLHGKAEYSGTGVGLSIVKKVVENHYGFIRVVSAVGDGSIFNIFLPVQEKERKQEVPD